MRIAIMLPNLVLGGAERVSITLADAFAAAGHTVEFVVQDASGELLEEVRARFPVHDLGARRLRQVLPPMVEYLRKAQCDIVLANMWPLTAAACLAKRIAKSRAKLAVVEHCPLSVQYAGWGRAHRLALRASLRVAFPVADARIAVSGAVADDLAQLSGLARHRFTVIHNPIPLPHDAATVSPRPRLDAPARILTVGKLKPEKNHALLIRAFARLHAQRPARLVILGEGECRAELAALAVSLGVADAVELPGYALDPYPHYRAADLFVLSSDFEGFGNVLVEAMGAGTPVVSTDAAGGPVEILAGGRYGRLVPSGDEAALAAAMATALDDPVPPDVLQQRARTFAPDRIAGRYLAAVGIGARD